MDITAPPAQGQLDHVPAASGGAMPFKASVAVPYKGGLTVFGSAAGFQAQHLSSLCEYVVKVALDPATAIQLRRVYGDGTTGRLDTRLAPFTSNNSRLCLVDTLLPVVPVELFTLVILLAALKVYQEGSPRSQKGKVETTAVLREITEYVAAGGRKFGFIQQAHVDAVLLTSVPVGDTTRAAGAAPSEQKFMQTSSLALILRTIPHEFDAVRRAGLSSSFSILPLTWMMWAAPTMVKVNSVIAEGGSFSIHSTDVRHYLEALGTLCNTRFNFYRATTRDDGSIATTYNCYRDGPPLSGKCDSSSSSDSDSDSDSYLSEAHMQGEGDDTFFGADADLGAGAGAGAGLKVGNGAGVGAHITDGNDNVGAGGSIALGDAGIDDAGASDSDTSSGSKESVVDVGNVGGAAGVGAGGGGPLALVTAALDGKKKKMLPVLGTNCTTYVVIQMIPKTPSSIAIISFRGGPHNHNWDSDKHLIGLPSETDRAINYGGTTDLSASSVQTNAKAVIQRDMIYARNIIVGKVAEKEPVPGIGSKSSTLVHSSPGGMHRGRYGHRKPSDKP